MVFSGIISWTNEREKYLSQWEERVKEALDYGLSVGTLSVVNEELLKVGTDKTIEYLTDLGVSESGFLPFMLNMQNKEKKIQSICTYNDKLV